jgi:cell division topological specificity factor
VTWPCFFPVPKKQKRARRGQGKAADHHRARAHQPRGPDFLPALHRELIEVISKYTKVNADDIKISLDRQGNLEVLDVNVVLPDA